MWEKYKKFLENFFKEFSKKSKIFRPKHFKRLFISVLKCIELNSELILGLGGRDLPQKTMPNSIG